MNKYGCRPATPNEIACELRHLSEEEVIAYDRAGICFISTTGSFIIDNMEKVNAIILEKIIREL